MFLMVPSTPNSCVNYNFAKFPRNGMNSSENPLRYTDGPRDRWTDRQRSIFISTSTSIILEHFANCNDILQSCCLHARKGLEYRTKSMKVSGEMGGKWGRSYSCHPIRIKLRSIVMHNQVFIVIRVDVWRITGNKNGDKTREREKKA